MNVRNFRQAPHGASARVAAAAAVLAFVAGGCSSGTSTPSAAESEFVVEMAISASTSLALADIATSKSKDPQVRELALAVSRDTAPIVDALSELGPALAADGAPGFAHTDEEDHDHATPDQTMKLRTSPTKAFDQRFLTLLRTELDSGLTRATKARSDLADPRTVGLAERVVSTWTALQEDAMSMTSVQ